MQIGYLSANPFASDAEQFTITPEQQAAQRLHDAAPELLAALVKIDKLASEADTDANSQAVLALQVSVIARIALDKANG